MASSCFIPNEHLQRTDEGTVRIASTKIACGASIAVVVFEFFWLLAFFFAIMKMIGVIGVFIFIAFHLLLACITLRLLGIFPAPHRKILIDCRHGRVFPKGAPKGHDSIERYMDASGIPFSSIRGIRVTEEEHVRKNSRYTSRRLAFELTDGTELELLNHTDKRIHQEAENLSLWTGIPLLETTSLKAESAESAVSSVGNAGKRVAKVYGVLFGLISIGVSCLILFFLTARPLITWNASRNWVSTEAVIVDSRLVRSRGSKGSPTCRIAVSFKYTYGGRTCVSSTYDCYRSTLSTNIGVRDMERIVAENPPGRQVTCLVNPDKPEQAIVSREIPWALFSFTFIFPTVFFLAGSAIIWNTLRGKKPASAEKGR